MLNNLLHELKRRNDSSDNTRSKAETTGDLQFYGLQLYNQLVLATPQPLCAFQTQKLSSWQLPLPFDVLFTIVDTYFLDDQDTIINLHRTCWNFTEVCRPFLYHTVTLRVSSEAGAVPTAAEKFGALVSKFPYVIDRIRTLRILDHGRMFQGSRPITAGEESLCYILTRRYSKLKRLELSLHGEWTLIPTQLRHAFEIALSSPILREINFEHLRIPVDLFRFFKDLRVLEMQGEPLLPSPAGAASTGCTSATYCLPERLSFEDGSHSGFVTSHLFHNQSALQLSKLGHLQVYMSNRHLPLLKVPFEMCKGNLTILELYVGTWGGLPRVPDLGGLAALKSLTLSSDISMMPYGTTGTEGPFRFNWLVSTLATCPRPSRLESITFIIRTRSFYFADKLRWGDLDTLFSPAVKVSWPRLRVFDLLHINETKEDVRMYVEGTIDAIVLPIMPILAWADVLKFRVSDERMEFWRL